MNITLSCPSKTFLLGEYVALYGAPTLVINTTPRFALHVIDDETQHIMLCRSVNTRSPAGNWLQQYKYQFKNYCFEFSDPHKGHGGLGASSAQFLLFLAFKNYLENKSIHIDEGVLLQNYLKFSWDGLGIAPSGADLIAQLHGNITYFHKEKNQIEQLSWPFENIEFMLVRSGNKIATHNHLKHLMFFSTENLSEIVLKARDALIENNEKTMVQAINDYAKELFELHFVAEETIHIIEKFNNDLPILAIKGCGALGADVILMIYEKSQQQKIKSYLNEHQFSVIGTNADLTEGISLKNHE